MEHRNVKNFELTAFVPNDDSNNAFAMIFTPSEGEPFLLSMPASVAAEIAARLSEALAQIAREGKPVSVPVAPERITRYTARQASQAQGEEPAVEVLLVGDRSPPLYCLMPQTDARRLGALLMAEAESSGPKRAN